MEAVELEELDSIVIGLVDIRPGTVWKLYNIICVITLISYYWFQCDTFCLEAVELGELDSVVIGLVGIRPGTVWKLYNIVW